MKIKGMFWKPFLTVGMLVATAGANAALIQAGMVPLNGTGIGAVKTVLTVDSDTGNPELRDNKTVAKIGRDGGVDVVTEGNATPLSLNNTWSLAELGLTLASELRIVFNPNEPAASADTSITLQNMVLTFYTDQGGVLGTLFSSALGGPIDYAGPHPGIGDGGFGFRLSDDDAVLAQGLAFSGPDASTNRIGLSAELWNAHANFDTFFAMRLVDDGGGDDDEDVPEPASLALFGLGLAAFGFVRRSKNQR